MRSLRPAPDGAVVCGAVLGLLGYVLPWFKRQDGYLWSFSGWAYASLSTGGGWTLLTVVWLAATLVAGLWARASPAAAMAAVAGAVGALFFALAVVAVSFAEFPERGSLNWVGEIPFGIGLPVLAVGLGLLVAGGVRAVVRTTARPGSHPAPDA